MGRELKCTGIINSPDCSGNHAGKTPCRKENPVPLRLHGKKSPVAAKSGTNAFCGEPQLLLLKDQHQIIYGRIDVTKMQVDQKPSSFQMNFFTFIS
jgi:hypothetical protein